MEIPIPEDEIRDSNNSEPRQGTKRKLSQADQEDILNDYGKRTKLIADIIHGKIIEWLGNYIREIELEDEREAKLEEKLRNELKVDGELVLGDGPCVSTAAKTSILELKCEEQTILEAPCVQREAPKVGRPKKQIGKKSQGPKPKPKQAAKSKPRPKTTLKANQKAESKPRSEE